VLLIGPQLLTASEVPAKRSLYNNERKFIIVRQPIMVTPS